MKKSEWMYPDVEDGSDNLLRRGFVAAFLNAAPSPIVRVNIMLINQE